jgi:hypothetical protein
LFESFKVCVPGFEGTQLGDFTLELGLLVAQLVNLHAGDHTVSAGEQKPSEEQCAGDDSASRTPGAFLLPGVVGADDHGIVDRLGFEVEVFAGEGRELTKGIGGGA